MSALTSTPAPIKKDRFKHTVMSGTPLYTRLLNGWIPTEYAVYRINVGKDLARVLLARNTHNRLLNDERLRKMEKKLLRGHGRFTHQGVGFSETGVLLDGQHRLNAIVNTGVSLETQITFGLDDDVQEVIDDGLGRSLGVQMSLKQGHAERTNPAAQIYNQLEILLTSTHGGRLRDLDDLSDFKAKFGDFDDTIKSVLRIFKPKGKSIKNAYVKGALVLAYRGAPEKVKDFIRKFGSGEGVYSGDPAMEARNICDRAFGTIQKNKSELSRKLLRCIFSHIHDEKIYIVKTRCGDIRFFAEKNGITLPAEFKD